MITELNVLDTYCSQLRREDQCALLRQQIRNMKDRLIAAAWGEPAGVEMSRSPGLTPRIRDPFIDVTPHSVSWRAELQELQPSDRLAVVWYELDEDWRVWTVMPEVSGKIDRVDVTHPASWFRKSYLGATNFKRCLGDDRVRRYKAEFYINGRFLEQAPEITAPASDFTATRLDDLNVALCHPSQWVHADARPEVLKDGALVRELRTRDGRPAVFMFTFYSPNPATGRQERDLTKAIDRARMFLLKNESIPNGPSAFAYLDRARPEDCEQALSDSKPMFVSWRTVAGVRHIGVALPGVASPHETCAALMSMTNHHTPGIRPVAGSAFPRRN